MIYVSTKPNLFRAGYEEIAEIVSRRVRNGHGMRYCVWVDFEGKVTLRPRYDKRAKPLPDADLIGTYDRHTRVEWIEADLIARSQELTGRKAA